MHSEILNELDKLTIEYTNHTHQKLHTVSDAQAFDQSIKATPTKNLFLKDKKKNYFLITCFAYAELNLKDIAKIINAKGSLSFVKEPDLQKMMNLTPGNVTPFGLIYAKEHNFNIKFYLDQTNLKNTLIGIHPLRNDMTTVLHSNDLIKLLLNFNILTNEIIL